MIEIHNLLHNIELPLLEAVADLRESSIDRSDLVLHLGACCVLRRTFHCFCGGGLFPAASAIEISPLRGVLDSHPAVVSVRMHRGKVVINDECKADHYTIFANYAPNSCLILCPDRHNHSLCF